jgi:Kef-type K+ transport system membrane component KefB
MTPKARTVLVYAGLLGAGIGAFFAIRHFGRSLIAPIASGQPAQPGSAVPESDNLLVHALIALLAIVLAARICGALFRRMKQPAVIGEMVAGILLGPSLLGRLAPALSAHLFPTLVLPFLSVVSQIGVILFMFLVGVQLDLGLLRNRTRAALAISHASIVVPFLCGAALALWLYPSFSSRGVSFAEFALFIGVSMSVTAFPVLARILTDRRMHESRIGPIALACAAVDDVTAWCLLAFVVGVARAQPGRIFLTVGLTAAFIILMLTLVRPAALWFVRRESVSSSSSQSTMATVCAALLLSALATQRIGIHALFGAFLLGVVIPHDSALAQEIKTKLEDAVVAFLLPVFFVYTGLRTEINLVHGARDWIACGAIILVASAGKFGGSYVAGRLTGLGGREAASLGILMNTRGLMELIVLNVGLDLGVLSPTLFAMFVLMALVTTFATTPILQSLKRTESGDA